METLHVLLPPTEEREMVRRYAAQRGYAVETFERLPPRLTGGRAPLGWMVAGTSDACATRVVRALRADGPTRPIIALVEDAAELVRCRLAGATDCVRRPADSAELFARTDASLAVALVLDDHADLAPAARAKGLAFFANGEVRLGAHRARLRRAELAIVRYIIDNGPRVVGTRELLAIVLQTSGDGGTVRNHVCELRRKLKVAGFPQLISTVRGVGYVAGSLAPDHGFAASPPPNPRGRLGLDLTSI